MSPYLRAALLVALTSFAAAAYAQAPQLQPPAATSTTVATPVARPAATPQPTPPDTVLLRNADAVVYQRDYDAALERIPENMRGGFGIDVDRINTLLQQLLTNKTVAAQARKQGVDKDPAIERQITVEADKILAAAMLERTKLAAQKEFDALPNIDAAARERWLTQQDKFREPSRYKLTVIVFLTKDRKAEEARQLAAAARTKILAGADMSALAREISEDPAAKETGGVRDWTTPAAMDPATARAVERLAAVGDVSPPVNTQGGVLLLRLDAKEPGAVMAYEKAKPAIMDQLRAAYVDEKVADRFKAIKNDPALVVNQAAVDALVVRVDADAIRRATDEAAARRRLSPTPPTDPRANIGRPRLQPASPATK